ncbi:TIM barrel protein [Fulvivirgaceae bacterium BMA10]|uniref:TIM barrel protein n=1 Tax=Splendidivirga corallicola TaxID=3051826 RepID=A0ABT8KI78_9BACT|nr:TIM barrel protein [Fulvivirgaceae bacterium BMA10]
MKRRKFVKNSIALGSTITLAASQSNLTVAKDKTAENKIEKHKFNLKYAPHFGMFTNHSGKDLLDQLQFMSEVGFTALEDNGMPRRSVEDQKKIGKKMEQLGMEMGVFVAYANFNEVTFAGNNKDAREGVLKNIRSAVEVAKRCNAKWMTVVPGAYDKKLHWDYQTANCVELLKRCSDILEPHGLVMVLEPLNWHANHPGVFLTKMPQSYMICKAVNSPSCKILDDLYHQQITEGNLIPNIDMSWDEIAYFQVGDNPGRKEPTTGEINYNNVFKHIHKKGFNGIVGMEHGNSQSGKEGELAVIEAYKKSDAFL